jgi:outer membrane protein
MNNTQPLKHVLIWIWLMAFALPVWAQQTAPLQLTLEQAKQNALNLNKTLKMSKMDIEVAKKKVMETTAIGLPQLNFEANYQHVFKVPEFGFGMSGYTQNPLEFANGTNPNGFSQFTPSDPAYNGISQYYAEGAKVPIMEKDNATFNFQLSQLIFSGEYIVGLQATRVFKTISEQMLVRNELDVLLDIESTYHLALVLDKELDIVRQNVELTQKNVDEMKAMLANGFLEDTEVDQQILALTGLRNFETSLMGQLRSTLNLLKFQMGMDLTQPIELTDDIEVRAALLPPLVTENFLMAENIEYQMATNQVEIQKLNLRREQSTFLPTIAGFYQHQEKLKEPALDFTPKDLLGVSLTLPIFTSTQRLMKVKQASIELDKSMVAQAQLADGLALQFETQKLTYETAYSNYINQKMNKEVSKRIFDKTSIKMKEGVSSSLELTQVQAQYLNANKNYYDSILALLNAKAGLNRLMSKRN